MIHFIKGVITDTMQGMVVIENGNIGYEVHVPDNCFALFSQSNELVTLYTSMIVREDDISLYGFSDTQSLSMFNLLRTVSGIGAKAAMSILSSLSADDIKKAIAFEDIGMISKANGIGKKTAQRIILELKDKIGEVNSSYAVSAKEIAKGSARDDAAGALIALGYSRSEALNALSSISENDLSTEEYIKRALRMSR